MLVCFDEIPPLGRDFAWQITTLDVTGECTLDTPLAAWCHVQPVGQGKVEIQGLLQGTLSLACDRCLISYPLALDSAFRLTAVVQPPASGVKQAEQQEDIGQEDFDSVELDIPCVDLDEVMRQQLFLALPGKRLCRSDCGGLCPHYGADRNKEQCGCAHKMVDSPFSVLAKLAKGKK